MGDFEAHAARIDRAMDRETELALRFEPVGVEIIASASKIAQHLQEIGPDEMWQHETIMQRRAPAHQTTLLRLTPEPSRQRANQQLLGQAHPRFGRHFETAKFQQAQAPGRAVGREHLVDADFGAVGVAGHIDQQIAEQAIDQPWGRRIAVPRKGIGHLRQRDFQLVQAVMPGLVDARGLTRRADAEAREEVG